MMCLLLCSRISSGCGGDFLLKNIMKNLLFLLLCMLYSQAALTQYSLMGNVTDTQGNYLPGATILLHPTDRGAISNADGFFIISNLPKGSYTLAVSYVGYETFETTIELKENVVLDLVLKDGFTTICTVVVKNTWADANSPVTHTNIPKEEIEKINLAQDVPYLLKWTPSLVVTSDAGAGIGYTGMRIRGSDPTRINVSINGVP
ncbi:MAG TPA: PEGA domain-containing protein, partial [Phaeodactylibacter sp.]|nr:PEGA domain-containing protein [Phaeodactylibacter sp.]